jgi:hypothetical protein
VQTGWSIPASFPSPVGPRLRGLGWLGTTSAAVLVVWLLAGPTILARAVSPPLVLVGPELLRATFELGGHAQEAFRLALAVLWLAVPLAVATRGYRYASRAGQLAVGLVGSLGLAAATPVVAAMVILAANVALWTVLLVVGAVVFLLLLLGILTAPFRR